MVQKQHLRLLSDPTNMCDVSVKPKEISRLDFKTQISHELSFTSENKTL